MAWFSLLDTEWLVVNRGFERWLEEGNFEGPEEESLNLRSLMYIASKVGWRSRKSLGLFIPWKHCRRCKMHPAQKLGAIMLSPMKQKLKEPDCVVLSYGNIANMVIYGHEIVL
jgi:hypothetical protein